MPSIDYQKREETAVKAIKDAIPANLKKNMLKISEGQFAELYENKEIFPNHYLACGIDGVGTKVLIAEGMKKFDTVGIDCVAMNANDLATLGQVSPFIFLDYLACQAKIEEEGITGDIIKGVVKGLEQCDASDILRNSICINFGKGETASADELLGSFNPGYGFDIGGALIGFIKKEHIKKIIEDNFVIIAFESSGPHSNGYTDLRNYLLDGKFEKRDEFRKRYKGRFSLNDKIPGTDQSIGTALLEPTRIYVKVMAAITEKFPYVMGINNTGYGLKNFNRIKGFEFIIENPMKPQPIFRLMQDESKFSDEEMYKRFNMGMGFFIIADKDDADEILKIAKEYDTNSKVIGYVNKSSSTQTILIKGENKIIYEGY